MVEEHKSSRLMVANQLADLAGYQPLSIALFMNEWMNESPNKGFLKGF